MKSLCLVLLVALGVPGCSMMTKSGRQERAYSKYVRKMSGSRDKQRLREIKQRAEMPKLRPAPVSEPVENVTISESQ
jgi:hypothetical protein